MKKLLFYFWAAAFLSCGFRAEDTFNSVELTSGKGEKIYINSLNWGVTDDNQLTAVSTDKEKLTSRKDSVAAVKGLEPFIYRFENDSLHLYFLNEKPYNVLDNFRTVTVDYIVLGYEKYDLLRAKAYNNDKYHSVPLR